MIDSLQHLPHSNVGKAALDERFTDLAPPLTPRQAMVESQRCLYCYDAPCTRACPTEIPIASFINNIASGNINGAAFSILQQNILGASCARVCPTEELCEQACVRNHDAEQQPVKIGLLQRYALDHMEFGNHPAGHPAGHPFTRAAATGQRIAIVGAGPAGLSCAHRLALLGHDVVIFEAQAKSGGLNEYGIAKYKLPGDTAQKEVEFLLQIGGIEIRHGLVLGENLALAQLHQDFDAVFLGLGLSSSRQLGLTGEQAPGLIAATEYIAALRQADDLSQLPLAKRAIVIGAGNTAIDIAVQSAKLGALDVNIVYRRGADQMSATLHERDIARAHQVRIHEWAQPREVLLNADGKVCGMRFERTRLENDQPGGKLIATGETFDMAADAIFKAVGQQFANLDAMLPQLLAGKDKIVVDSQFRTQVAGIYAGGDCVAAGVDLTVHAVQQGKLAAHAINADLAGKDSNNQSKNQGGEVQHG
jgi:glutamate synthase (NADPH/NADH) small chain